jgi:hypothetical protein
MTQNSFVNLDFLFYFVHENLVLLLGMSFLTTIFFFGFFGATGEGASSGVPLPGESTPDPDSSGDDDSFWKKLKNFVLENKKPILIGGVLLCLFVTILIINSTQAPVDSVGSVINSTASTLPVNPVESGLPVSPVESGLTVTPISTGANPVDLTTAVNPPLTVKEINQDFEFGGICRKLDVLSPLPTTTPAPAPGVPLPGAGIS